MPVKDQVDEDSINFRVPNRHGTDRFDQHGGVKEDYGSLRLQSAFNFGLLVIRPQSAARKNTRELGVLFKLVGSRLSARGSHQVKFVTRMLRGSTPPRLHPAVPDA